MSIEQGQHKDIKSLSPSSPTKSDHTIAELEKCLADAKDMRYQDRFYFVTALILLLDVLLLKECNSILVAFVCTVEFVVIMSLADKWGIEQISVWAEKGLTAFKTYCKRK